MYPPAKYDVPYEGNLEIRYFSDVKDLQNACPHLEGAVSGSSVSACAQSSVDHKNCSVHALTEEAAKRNGGNLAFSLRHELAHCNGWYHPVAKKQFHEGDIWPEAEGAKWIRSATKVLMPKLPTSARILAASPPVVCVTPEWKQEPCSERKYKDELDAWAKGAGPAGQPSHIFHRRCACPAPPLQWDGGDGGTMANDDTASKRRADPDRDPRSVRTQPIRRSDQRSARAPGDEGASADGDAQNWRAPGRALGRGREISTWASTSTSPGSHLRVRRIRPITTEVPPRHLRSSLVV